MAEPARVQPDEVAIIGPDGAAYAVPKMGVEEAQRLGGRIASPDELHERQYGGAGGMLGAAGLGALETATMGGSTALAGEYGVLTGGQDKRASIEDSIRQIEQTNPIAHAFGEAAPLFFAPEAGGEKLAASLIKGESAMARAARFVGPAFVRGTVETAAIEGSQGINEGLLDHDLAAESFYIHAMKPEALYGGLINVGVASAFKGLGSVSKLAFKGLGSASKLARGGRVGEIAANDAALFDNAVRSVQMRGGTSEEANAAIRDVQGLAERRASLVGEDKALIDAPAEQAIRMHSRGDPDVARRLTRIYRDGSRVAESLDNEMTGLAKHADAHLTSIVNDLATMERAQFGLKQAHVQALADPSRVQVAADAANGWLRELRATITPIKPPPAPKSLESFERDIMREWKARGGKVPDDPAAAEAYRSRARTFAEAARESAIVEHTAEVERLTAERMSRIDPEVQRLIGYDPATRVGVANKDLRALDTLLSDSQREIGAAIRQGGAEGHARLFTALDDTKRVIGRYAKFSTENHAAAKQLERYLYQNRLQPMLEDSNIWGSRLAELQTDTNKAFHESFEAVTGVRNRFMGSFESPNGMRNYTPNGNTKGFIEGLGTYENHFDEQLVSKVTDAARARGTAMLKTMDLPAPVRTAVERAGKSATELEGLLEKAKVAASDAREIRALKARESGRGASGIVGTLMSFAVSPARTLETLAGFRKAETEVRKILGRESSGFLKGESVPTVKPMLHDAERKAAIQSVQDIQRYQTDPRSLAISIKDMLGDMPEIAPNVTASVAQTIARGVVALAKRAPVPLPPRFADPPGEQRFANGDLERYWRDKQLVERPLVVMQLMRAGQLHQEDVDLMKEVIPRVFAQMQMQLDQDVLNARRKGGLRTMSYQEQLALSWMLGRPLDESQNPNFVAAMQASAASDPMNQAAFGRAAMGGGRPKTVDSTGVQQMTTLDERLSQ